MATITRGKHKDAAVKALKGALEEYESLSIGSQASLYKRNELIRIRIVDDRFEKLSRGRRHDKVWKFLADRVDDDVMSQISMLILLPESELSNSLTNSEFEKPLPSLL